MPRRRIRSNAIFFWDFETYQKLLEFVIDVLDNDENYKVIFDDTEVLQGYDSFERFEHSLIAKSKDISQIIDLRIYYWLKQYLKEHPDMNKDDLKNEFEKKRSCNEHIIYNIGLEESDK